MTTKSGNHLHFFVNVSKPILEILISGGLIVKDTNVLEVEDLDALKNRLAFDNPAYAKAMRYSKYSYVSIPEKVYYFSEQDNHLSIPTGFPLSKFLDEDYDIHFQYVLDFTKTLVSPLPPFKLTLRKDQEDALSSFLKYNTLESSSINGLIQLPTGKGKSILGLAIANALKCKTLIVVHKDDLVTGWKNDIKFAFEDKVHSGLIKAKSREVGHFLTIATVQTLNRLSDADLQKLQNEFGLLILDECHHVPANTYSIITNFNAPYRLGLTATPERADGLGFVMKLYFGNFCFKYDQNYMETEKDILPVKVYIRELTLPFDPICISHVTSRGNTIWKYDKEQVSVPNNQDVKRLSALAYQDKPLIPFGEVDTFVVTHPLTIKTVCNDLVQAYSNEKSCVVFFTQKKHLDMYLNYLTTRLNLSRVQIYSGDTKDPVEVLKRAESKEILITLTTLAKSTEGTNVRAWEYCFLVSSMNNGKNVEQAVGRVRRIKSGKSNFARVYDYRYLKVYGMDKHGVTRNQRYRQMKLPIVSKERIIK